MTDAPPAADPATDPATPPADPATPPPSDPPADPATPPGDDKQVSDLRNEAAKYRTQRNELQQQLDTQAAQLTAMQEGIAKALGIKTDAEADPAQQVTDLTGQVQSLTTRNQQLEAELLVHTLAPEHQGNAVALLDSRAFLSSLHGLDSAAEDYRDQVAAAIKTAVDASPTLRTGQAPSAGGAPNAGQGAGGADSVTAEEFGRMTYGQRTELYNRDPALYRRLAGD